MHEENNVGQPSLFDMHNSAYFQSIMDAFISSIDEMAWFLVLSE